MANRKWRDSSNLHRGITKKFICTLIIGVVCGYTLGYIILYKFNLLVERLNKTYALADHISLENEVLSKNYFGNNRESIINEFYETKEKSSDINKFSNVRILCWVMTSPINHEKKAVHVKATWGKRCDIILFMSSEGDLDLPAVALPVKEGRNNLWAKTKEAFKHIYNNYFDLADWFFKADDDTYVIVENLKYLLANHNTSEPLYFGWRFQHLVKQGFMSGGAGYVLSKTALEKFILEALPNKNLCRQDHDGDEDTELGICLENVGVTAMNSRDSLDRERFFPLIPTTNMIPGRTQTDFWYFTFSYYFQREGFECCSDSAISFHYVPPKMMYAIDHLIYQMKPYGIDRKMLQTSIDINNHN